ncbi:hypothetical protein ACT17Q_01525 [Cellulomonas sp. CW35]|uniref:hypothetical protein n=1 Tax=Cellulomonas sp. CW35 TaxID=3458249 RepID=UPI004034E298
MTAGALDASGSAFPDTHSPAADFADRSVPLHAATHGAVRLSARLVPALPGTTYGYRIAPMDTNTAGATVTAAGVLTATRPGHVRVTATATAGGVSISESALVTVTPAKRPGGPGPGPGHPHQTGD